MLEGRPLPIRSALAGRLDLARLKLGSDPAERFVLGWELRRSTGDHARLGAASRVGMPAELLFLRRPEGLVLATLVRQETTVARTMWAAVAPLHRQVVPYILDLTARRKLASQPKVIQCRWERDGARWRLFRWVVQHV